MYFPPVDPDDRELYSDDIADESYVDDQLYIYPTDAAPRSFQTWITVISEWEQAKEGRFFTFYNGPSERLDGTTVRHHLFLEVNSGTDLGTYTFEGYTTGTKKALKH